MTKNVGIVRKLCTIQLCTTTLLNLSLITKVVSMGFFIKIRRGRTVRLVPVQDHISTTSSTKTPVTNFGAWFGPGNEMILT